jgi:hypothetical protein
VDTSSREILQCDRLVAVGHVFQRGPFEREKGPEDHLRQTRHSSPQVPVRLLARQLREIGQRRHRNIACDGDSHRRIDRGRDWDEVSYRIERQAIVQKWAQSDLTGRSEKERVLIVCRHEVLDTRNAVRTRAIVDHNGLLPAL